MTLDTPARTTDLSRRLERFRTARGAAPDPDGPLPYRPVGSAELARRLAETLGGEIVERGRRRFVRVESPTVSIPVDRGRLARLPGQPPPGPPLVCLDTETTGLATATGTVAFCVGLGWWSGTDFRQVQLLLPDHADEPVLLEEIGRLIPPDAWLVTYNGRGFDWPLLVTRFRMAGRAAPPHDGHLDLLPVVRRVFRHRMADARLKTAEETLLGMVRHDDVDGWEIPARYLGFLRGGPPHPLLAVVRHNAEDVRSLARLLGLLDTTYATADARRSVPVGDLAGLARAFARLRQHEEALACLEEALARDPSGPADPPTSGLPHPGSLARGVELEPWWSPRAVPDFGGRPRRPTVDPASRRAAFAAPWDATRIATDRAHLLRRLGRYQDALEAWTAIAAGPGRSTVVARIEMAKLLEHRLGDRAGALAVTLAALEAAGRRRHLGLPEPALEAGLHRRLDRLRRRGSVVRRVHPDLGTRARDDEPAHVLP